jgi:hypothetical protein
LSKVVAVHEMSPQEPTNNAGVATRYCVDVWLRRSHEQKLITFSGKKALLDSLDLPVPDPMVLRPTPSLKSPRVPASVLFFEGERIEVLRSSW